MFKSNMFKKGLVIASTAAVALGGVTIAPDANASGGKPGPTGIVWGNDNSQEGAYQVTLTNGKTLTGFCIDPGKAYPNQNGGTKYGEAIPWGGQLSQENLKKITLALFLGKMIIENPQQFDQVMGIFTNVDGFIKNAENQARNLANMAGPFKGQANQMIDSIAKNPDLDAVRNVGNALKGASKDDVAEAVAGVVHKIGGDYNPDATNKWGENRQNTLRPKARSIYDAIMNNGQRIPQQLLDQTQTKLYVRVPQNPNYQKMLVVSDIKIPDIPLQPIKFPEFQVPTVPEVPSTDKEETTKPSRQTTRPTGDNYVPETTPSTVTTPSVPETETTVTTPSTTKTTTPTVSTSRTPEKPEVEIRTSAGTKEQNILEIGREITDTVYFKGLEVGKTYTLKAVMMDSATGEETGNSGETTFVAEASNGQVDVPITVKNVDAAQQTVFESLYEEGEKKPIAEHKDLEDNSQIVGRPVETPEIRTSASSSTGNYIQSGTTVTDNVTYRGLIPGKEYRLEARLICKATGADTGASQSVSFIPQTAEGVQPVANIAVTDPDCFEQVAFEKLYDDQGVLVAFHEDINDASQTVGGPQAIAKKKKKTPPTPTPEDTPVLVVESPAPSPAPAQMQEQNQRQAPNPAPAPAPVGGGTGGGAPGGGSGGGNSNSNSNSDSRGVVNAVPSGGTSVHGFNIFNR